MSKQEQAALVAWINSFRPSRRITSFENLADGRAFMELLSGVDSSHFKNPPIRGPGAGPSSPDNWVLKINTLKRIYRLLLSLTITLPHHSLSTSTLPEPPFSTIVKYPTSAEGTAGLIQLARMVLCVAVWAPGNDLVIAKIQGLGEAYMAELMRGIEEIMGSMPPEDEGEGDDGESGGMMDRLSRRGSPIKRGLTMAGSPPGALRAERDRLSAENDELRLKAEQMADQVADITTSLDEARSERDDALERLANARDTSSADLRSSQGAGNDVSNLRSELLKSEETIAKLQDDLSSKTIALGDLQTSMEKLEEDVSEANKLKDRLDEYRHIEEKLRKSENVIEKYKKKLEDTAVVRRELKNLEEENAQLLSINNGLEGQLKRVGQGKSSPGDGREKLAVLEAKLAEQATELSELSTQLDTTRMQLFDTEAAHERDKEDLELYRQKVSELELGSGDTTLTEEISGGSLGTELEGVSSPAETRTDLKLKIRRLERELADRSPFTGGGSQESTLQSQLKDAEESRDQYLASIKSLHEELDRLRLDQNANAKNSEAEPDYSAFEEAQKSYEAQISRLKLDLETARTDSKAVEKRYNVEQELMLSAWHDLGNKVVREHLGTVVGGVKRSQSKVVPMGWLGRQKRWKEDAIFSRTGS